MTSETRTVVELSDVLGVEFECPHCGAKVLYPVKEHKGRLAEKCPACFEPWLEQGSASTKFEEQEPIAEQISKWMNGMRRIGERSDIHAKVRLHVNTKGLLLVDHASTGKD